MLSKHDLLFSVGVILTGGALAILSLYFRRTP